MSSGPSVPSPKNRPRRWTIILGGVLLLLVIGYAWTMFFVRADESVTVAETQALRTRVDDNQAVASGAFFPIKERLVQYELERGGEVLTAYALEYYSLFGLRVARVALECWDVRPGIDGVAQVPPAAGTLTGSIWCDGIEL